MRKTCYACVRKHLGSASAFDDEIALGYPQFMLRFIGQLDHAATEAVRDNPELAEAIRGWRLIAEARGLAATQIPFDAFSEYLDVCLALGDGQEYPELPKTLVPLALTADVNTT